MAAAVAVAGCFPCDLSACVETLDVEILAPNGAYMDGSYRVILGEDAGPEATCVFERRRDRFEFDAEAPGLNCDANPVSATESGGRLRLRVFGSPDEVSVRVEINAITFADVVLTPSYTRPESPDGCETNCASATETVALNG